MNDDTSVAAEDASLTADATGDSCIRQFIEMVPLHISDDIKQEPEECGSSVVDVSLYL